MDTNALAHAYAALCIAGKSNEAGLQFWSPDVVSVEALPPEGGDAATRGIEAVKAKGEWWYSAHDVHSADAIGPFINGDQFVIRYKLDVTVKETGQRRQMDEDALYTVKNGKVVEERFFYSM